MSVKKLLVLSAAGAAAVGMTAVAMAGGPDQVVPVAAPPAPISGVYLEGNLGYARVNWGDTIGVDNSVVNWNTDGSRNLRGGITFGFDLGYQWNQYWAAEIGWYYLPATTLAHPNLTTITGSTISADSFKTRSWAAYLAAKIMIPLMMVPGSALYFKGGVAYRRIRFSNSLQFSDTNAYKWTPMFAVGLQWMFMHSWIFDLQYMRFVGGRFNNIPSFSGLDTFVPAANLFTVSLGYMFAM
jgi:opacity protein-like surface antigen